MGQVLSDEGDNEEAINCLIDALRWDSRNAYALIMMGNIFARSKDDIATAMKYFDQALVAKPDDNIAINNIGANLLQENKIEEAKLYFVKALSINNKYPNTHFALSMIAEMENDLHSSFYSAIRAIQLNNSKDVLYQNSVTQAFEIAKKIVSTDQGKKIFREYRHKLEFEGTTEIDIVADANIPFNAKIEFAENYNRPKHIVRYKPERPCIEHLIMHELVHLDLVIQARKEKVNQLFVSTQQHKNNFIKSIEPTLKRLSKEGVNDKAIASYCDSLFEGLNSQTFNTPIDLFIENTLHTEFPELRPYQFLSLYVMILENIKAVTDKKIVDIAPKAILSKSKIYNVVVALQFKDLYGFDLIKDFKTSTEEMTQAKDFYDEFLQYLEDKKPAEEYEMLLHWAEDLELEKNFELIDEIKYRTKNTDIDNLLTSIENDPFGQNEKDPSKEREMEQFQKSQQSNGTNMAVAMFMVDALQYFDGMPSDQIKKIAFEIALQGTQGYSPDKKDYRISFIPGKLFSGYHILAYYYVSWALAIPESLSKLQLPFDEEYQIAKSMFKPKL